jgi:methionyl-tRNA formyltransferase
VYHETSIVTLRLAFFGSDCLYSDTVLQTLLHSPHKVAAVILPAAGLSGVRLDRPIQALLPENAAVLEYDSHALPVISPFVQRSILHTAWEKGISLFAVRNLADRETAGTLSMVRADVACVACFPRRIPASLLHVPRRGFLNVHPSLLPEYRGPAPIFWQLHEGATRTGVTVHWMDAEFDTGPVADQRSVPLADGITETDATGLMARAGARLLVEVLDHVAAGEIPYRKQPLGGSYQPYPHDGDFTISPTWPARRVYNFMRGTTVWGIPFRLEIGDEVLMLSDAVSWSSHERLEQPYVRIDDDILFQCSPGTVRARLA